MVAQWLGTLHHIKQTKFAGDRKHGSSVVRHLPLVVEVPHSIPARGEENFGV